MTSMHAEILPMTRQSFARSAAGAAVALALVSAPHDARAQLTPDSANDAAIASLVAKLDLEQYKATIKSLTLFGDRRQGTKRNRDAVDWIEAQLRRYGCSDVSRMTYDFSPPAPPPGRTPPPPSRGLREPMSGQGGSKLRGRKAMTGVNTDSLAQPEARLRTLNAEPSTPGKREQVYCTKIGSTRPDEMYIIGAHMDGIGWGEAANDDGSGTAIVMELARILSDPAVKTERSIRFALWNNEETGLNGARAYVQQRQALQGKEEPAGSGKFPEPKWLGMIQHDMMLWDHGMPLADGTLPKEQRPEADVNVEFQLNSKQWLESSKLAWWFALANERFATDYPVAVGPHMTNTDSGPFQDIIPSISLRENERGREIGAGWDPNWHQPSDVFATFSDKDFRLGLNAAQTTLGAVGRLVGVVIGR
jgi:hypothetical protein